MKARRFPVPGQWTDAEKAIMGLEAEKMKLVADATLDAAAALARGHRKLRWEMIVALTLESTYLAFAEAIGMRVPRLERILEPWRGAALEEFLERLRCLPYRDLGPEHLGAGAEKLSGYTVSRGELVASEGRRAHGVHYTPYLLAHSIAVRTLMPLFRVQAPARTLDLRICDPAVGGGVFLLAALRELAPRILKGGRAPDLLTAKRLAAIHCLYGVDISRFAVSTTKNAISLECRADGMPPDWLDDNVKCGDALVGLTAEQMKAFTWEKGKEPIPWVEDVVDEAMKKGRAARITRMEALTGRALMGAR